jgi:hypothetical protein
MPSTNPAQAANVGIAIKNLKGARSEVTLMSGATIEQYVGLAERVIWQGVVFYFMLRDYIRNHKK